MSWLKHLIFEQKKVWLVMFVAALFICQVRFSFSGENKFDVITVIITIVTITIGFATAALAMFLGITDKPVIVRIKKRNQVNSLVNGFKDLINSGGIVIITSIIMSVFNMDGLVISIWGYSFISLDSVVVFIFIFFTMLSLYYAHSLISLMLLIFKQLIIESE